MASSTELAAHRVKAAADIRQLSPSIGQDTELILADMYSNSEFGITKISIGQGAKLNEIVRRSAVSKSLEIGFAYGFSTVWILDALRSRRDTRHVAIDPFQKTYWRRLGLQHVDRLNAKPAFEWLEDYSIHVLTNFGKRKKGSILFSSMEITALMMSLSTSICRINCSR